MSHPQSEILGSVLLGEGGAWYELELWLLQGQLSEAASQYQALCRQVRSTAPPGQLHWEILPSGGHSAAFPLFHAACQGTRSISKWLEGGALEVPGSSRPSKAGYRRGPNFSRV